MRNHLPALLATSLVLLWGGCAYCQDSSESALGDPAPQALKDPSLSTSRYFPPSLGTSGVAAIAPKPSVKTAHGTNCNAANPCALPTPARDHVTVAQGRS